MNEWKKKRSVVEERQIDLATVLKFSLEHLKHKMFLLRYEELFREVVYLFIYLLCFSRSSFLISY